MYHFELRPNRRNALNPHGHWEKEVEKFFDSFTKTDAFAPVCEIQDDEKCYLIGLDIPGVSKEGIDIEVKDNHLHITGERKTTQSAEKDNILRSERHYGKFSRVFTLPQNVATESIQAKYENGVLEIILPKEIKTTTKKIAISGTSSQETSGSEFKN